MANSEADAGYSVGDLVVLMAEPGPFRVIAVDEPYLTIESPHGVTRKVRDVAVRRVTGEPPVAK